jgi:hypothetical protein
MVLLEIMVQIVLAVVVAERQGELIRYFIMAEQADLAQLS